ncbi:MAG TPA: hypothetical protein VF552_03490 [Allosphingosinicella sp.]|jgi:hypothetical protein
MLMTSLLLGAMIAPLDAQVVDIALQRTTGENAGWYNKVEVEFASAEGQTFRLCPGQAAVSTARLTGDRLRPVDRYPAHAMAVGRGSSSTSQCRDLSVGPGQTQRVTFFVRGVPGRWRGEDAYSFAVQAGARQFTFAQAEALPRQGAR